MGRVCPDLITKVEEEINEWASKHQTNAREALRNLWDSLSAEALAERHIGRLWQFHEAPFLLAFLRQFSQQGWRFSDAVPCASTPIYRGVLRALRINKEIACPSSGRELGQQSTVQSTDPLRELSQILAQHMQSAWDTALRSYANRGFPLSTNSPSRIIRLRAYGNAVNVKVAEAFVRAYMECVL